MFRFLIRNDEIYEDWMRKTLCFHNLSETVPSSDHKSESNLKIRAARYSKINLDILLTPEYSRQ